MMLEYQGKSLRRYCLENNLNYNTIKSRIRELGLSIEDALNYKYNRRSKKEIEEIKNWCKENDYKFSSINYKMKTYGLTKEEAANWKRKYCYEIKNESLYQYLLRNNFGKKVYIYIRKYVIEKNLSVEDAFNLWISKNNVKV